MHHAHHSRAHSSCESWPLTVFVHLSFWSNDSTQTRKSISAEYSKANQETMQHEFIHVSVPDMPARLCLH